MKIKEINQARHLQVHFELMDEIKDDSRFTPVKIWIAHTGKNLNKSYFSKKMLESMIPSLYYVPIVGFIQADSSNKDDFAGHEERIVVTVDGVEIEYLGRMYGFMPKECNPRFEMKNVNGVEREYLVADGLIVNKFAKAKQILDRDIEKGQSMELEVDTLDGYYEKENDQYVITSARFEALCILGDSKIPAMIGGAIEKIQFSAIKFELQEFIEELKTQYEKGGAGLNIERLLELSKDYSYVDESFIENLKDKLSDYETEDALIEVLKTENDTQFALTVNTQMEMLYKAVSALEMYRDRWGDDYPRYYMTDAKLDEMQVFCVDRKDYTDVGFTFTKNGEDFVIDKESAFKVAWQPVVLGEGMTANFEIGGEIKEVVNIVTEKFEKEIEEKTEEIKSEYETKLEEQKTNYESTIATQESELEELRAYKHDIETQTKKDYVMNVENLSSEEKDELVGQIDNYTIEEVVDEVAKIVGKKSIKFSAGDKIIDTVSVRQPKTDEKRRSYEVLFDENEK